MYTCWTSIKIWVILQYSKILITDACLPLDSLENGHISYSEPLLMAEVVSGFLATEILYLYSVQTEASIECNDGYIRCGSELRTC